MSEVQVTRLVVTGESCQALVELDGDGEWMVRCDPPALPRTDVLCRGEVVVWVDSMEAAQSLAAEMVATFDPMVRRVRLLAEEATEKHHEFRDRTVRKTRPGVNVTGSGVLAGGSNS